MNAILGSSSNVEDGKLPENTSIVVSKYLKRNAFPMAKTFMYSRGRLRNINQIFHS